MDAWIEGHSSDLLAAMLSLFTPTRGQASGHHRQFATLLVQRRRTLADWPVGRWWSASDTQTAPPVHVDRSNSCGKVLAVSEELQGTRARGEREREKDEKSKSSLPQPTPPTRYGRSGTVTVGWIAWSERRQRQTGTRLWPSSSKDGRVHPSSPAMCTNRRASERIVDAEERGGKKCPDDDDDTSH
ncbi:hypothetical protein BKA81DRAFT_380707 [Phyllosticta paracitricarpa]